MRLARLSLFGRYLGRDTNEGQRIHPLITLKRLQIYFAGYIVTDSE